MLHIGDLDLAARWLLAAPRSNWPARLALLLHRLKAGEAHRRATGTALIGAGNGSLASAVLVDGFPASAGSQEKLYLLALGAVCFHLAQSHTILGQ